MPLYRVPLPNGIIVQMEGPEGRERQAQAAAREYFKNQFPQEFEAWRSSQTGLGTSLGSGTSRAIDEFQGNLYAAAEGLGQLTGMQGLQDYGREGRLRNAVEAEAAFPQTLQTDILDVRTPGQAGRAAAEIVTGSLPSSVAGIGGALAGAATGARLGSIAGLPGAIVGGLLGGALASYPSQVGGNIQRQIQEDAARRGVPPEEGQIPSPGAAFVAGVPQAALESTADILTLKGASLLRKPTEKVTGTLGQRIRGGAITGAATEAPVEMIQTGIERAQADIPVFGEGSGEEYLRAGLGGAIGGGVLGGVARGAFGARPEPVAQQEPAEVQQPPVGEVPAPGFESTEAPAVTPTQAPPQAPPPAFESVVMPERPAPFATVAEAESFLAENPQFTPRTPLATPEAALAYVNAARASDWQSTITEQRNNILRTFVAEPAIEEGQTVSPEQRAEQASNFVNNLAQAATLSDINLNDFSVNTLAKTAFGVRDLDAGKISKEERKILTTQLDALVKDGFLNKVGPSRYSISYQPSARPEAKPQTAQEAQQDVADFSEKLATGTLDEAAMLRAGATKTPAPIAPIQPQDEADLWRGYSLNAGPQANSPFVREARNIAAVRKRSFTRPEFVEFAGQLGAAPTPEARDRVINDFVTGAAIRTPTSKTTVNVDGVERETTPENIQETVEEIRTGRPATGATPPPESPDAPIPGTAETQFTTGPELKTGKDIGARLDKQYEDSVTGIFKYFASPIMTMGKVNPIFRPASEALKRLYTRSQEATTSFAQLLEPAAGLSRESQAKIKNAMEEARRLQQKPDRANFTDAEYKAMESLWQVGQRGLDFVIESYVNKYFDPRNATTQEEQARLEAFQKERGMKHLWEMTPQQLENASPRGWKEMQRYNRMRDPYFFPQVATGSHFVAAYKRMPGGKEELVALLPFNPLGKGVLGSVQKARGFADPEAAAVKALREEFPDTKTHRVMSKGIQFENDQRASAVRKDGDFIAQYLQELSQVTGPEGKQIIARMSKEIDKAQMDRLFRPYKGILRTTTPENAADYILDTLPKYYLSLAKIQARNYIRDDFAKAIEPLTPNDQKYWNDLLDYATTPTEAFGTARALAFFMYLGLAVDTALINFSQLPFVTLPRLIRDGDAKASQYFGSALKTVMLNRNVLKAFKGDLAYTNDVISKNLNKDEAAALIKAREQGIFTPLYTNESRGQVSADSLRRFGVADKKAGSLAKGINWAADIAGRFMQAVEEVNRLSTFLAAYRMAKENPDVIARVNKIDNTQYTTPYEYAANTVFDTQFITSKEDRALVQRFTPAAEVATQFMSFPLKMIEQYVRHASMVLQGIKKQDAVVAKAGAVSLIGMIFPLVTVAGIWALPFADTIRELLERLIKAIWGTPVDFKVEIEKMLDNRYMASAINNGMPHAGGYASLQKRLAIDPVPAQDLLSASTLALFGPVGGLIELPFRGYDYWKNGDYWGLAATIAPRAVGNAIKGGQLATDAEQWSRRGIRMVTPEDIQRIDEGQRVPSSIRQAIGFPPPELFDMRENFGRKQEVNEQIQKATERVNVELSRHVLRFLEAQQRGDLDGQAKASEDFRRRMLEIAYENDGKPPNQQILINQSAIRQRAYQDFLGAANPQVLIEKTRRQARPEMQEEIERRSRYPAQ